MSDISQDPIRIVILDHQTLVRAGIRLIINNCPNMKVVGEAGDFQGGLEVVACQKPDIILLEIDLIQDQNPPMIPCLLEASGQARIILLSNETDPKAYLRAILDGALGVVFKTQSPELLVKAIEKVHAGEVWIERMMVANLITDLSQIRRLAQADPETEAIDGLSNRERQVIRLIGQGLKNQQIASQLCISETTVRHHLTSIYSKLGVADRLELLVFAHRFNLV